MHAVFAEAMVSQKAHAIAMERNRKKGTIVKVIVQRTMTTMAFVT
jgi:hypothetical protein